MAGRDDHDLYGSGVDRSSVGRGALRVLGFLVGVGVGFVGLALYAIRCFDTCPEDPAINAISQLLSGAVLLTGLAIAIEAISFRTAWSDVAHGAVAIVGGLIALGGVVSLALLALAAGPGGGAGTAGFAAVAVVVGAALVVNSLRERRPPRSGAPGDRD